MMTKKELSSKIIRSITNIIMFTFKSLAMYVCTLYSQARFLKIYCFPDFQKVWRRYKGCCDTRAAKDLGLQLVSYRSFCRYWHLLLPHIVNGKPRSDLCWTCQQNSMTIMKMANNTDREKDLVRN